MRIVIAGGHGKIARLLSQELLKGSQGKKNNVAGIIRNAEHEADLKADGAIPVVLDLEHTDVETAAKVLVGVDVAVFAAGAGPGSGIARKDTVDRAAAVLFADAAEKAGVPRFVQVSSFGVDTVAGGESPKDLDHVFYAYLVAKYNAEEDLKARRGLQWTIVRPGVLTDDPAGGKISLGESLAKAEVSRGDVAKTLAALITEKKGIRQTLEVTKGKTSIDKAVSALSE